ncbi:putative chemotaxis response regulator [Desulforapulum autotrophicum HRM2]|uniref:Chemotaxis response regulator n=2 Tax=Desulforapulum autotrophicum TaxID=2296 RepID=C0QDZ1_DESAH|nr:putative chemotaxis response regulator [Desulforapulum autotrophicum HRM2]
MGLRPWGGLPKGAVMTATIKITESILLVDDQPVNLQVLMHTLERLGCKLLVAKNGETALTIAQKARPDLILLDIMMPGIDGFEVCRRLKADPSTQKIPVIFLSALDDTGDKVRGLQLGAVDYVAKPFQPEEVIARVNTHLTIHRLSREVQQQRDELEHELQVVSQLQRNLLPERLPQVPGLRLAVHYETSRYAGGDYYDFMTLPGGLLAVLIADAEGHSAPAAVMMAMTCALFRSCSTGLAEPDRMLSFINENLCKVNRDSFVTAVYAVYDPARRTLRIACAGHPLPILYRFSEKAAAEIPCDSVLLMGLGPYADVPVTEVTLHPGDRILFYTDGVTDRFNASQERYGTNRLLGQFSNAASDDPEVILKEIVDDISKFAGDCPADDDQAMVIIVVD